MLQIPVESREREQLIDITNEVAALVKGVDEGVVWLHCPHTTAALTIQENTDPALRVDYLEHLGKLVPQPGFRHDEGNADAHIKSSLIGTTQPVLDRRGQAGARPLAGDLLRRARRPAPPSGARARHAGMKRLVVAVLVALAGGCAHTQKSRAAPRSSTSRWSRWSSRPIPTAASTPSTPTSLFERAGAAYGDKDFAAALERFDRIVARLRRLALRRPVAVQRRPRARGQGRSRRRRRALPPHHRRARRRQGRPSTPGTASASCRRRPRIGRRRRHLRRRSWRARISRSAIASKRWPAAASRSSALTISSPPSTPSATSSPSTTPTKRRSASTPTSSSPWAPTTSASAPTSMYRALPVRLPERQMARDLEAKARLLLVAQSRFIDAMRVQQRRVGDGGRLPDRLALPRVLRRPRRRPGAARAHGRGARGLPRRGAQAGQARSCRRPSACTRRTCSWPSASARRTSGCGARTSRWSSCASS